jgi:PleD family two-component response regulator
VVATLDVPSAGIGVGSVMVSIGLATGPVSAKEHAEALYKAADAALYEAKEGGRNQTRCAPSLVDSGVTAGPALRLVRA